MKRSLLILATLLLLLGSGAALADSISGFSTWCTVYKVNPEKADSSKSYTCSWDTYDACEKAGRGQNLPGNQPWTCVKNPSR